MRQTASHFIDANAGPNRLMAVANFESGLRIGQNFTDNAGRLKDALFAGRLGRLPINADAAFMAIKALAGSLANVPGRKAMVLFAGGLTLPGNKNALAEAIEACNRANVVVYPADVRNLSIQGSPSAENGGGVIDGRPITRTGGGASAGLRGEPGGGGLPAANLLGRSQEGMFPLANGTGGFVIRNASDSPRAWKRSRRSRGSITSSVTRLRIRRRRLPRTQGESGSGRHYGARPLQLLHRQGAADDYGEDR